MRGSSSVITLGQGASISANTKTCFGTGLGRIGSPPETNIPPDAPTGFQDQWIYTQSLGLVWDALPEGVTARIQWVPYNAGWDSLLGYEGDLAGTALTIASLSANTAYDVRIRAEKNGLTSEWVTLSQRYTLPATPTGLNGSPGAHSRVTLAWDDAPDVTWNLLRQGVTVNEGLTVADFDALTPLANTTYAFSVVAVSTLSGYLSPACDEVNVTSGAGSVPVNITPPSMPGAVPYTVSLGEWTADPDIYTQTTYQWYKDGIEDPTANTESYMPTEAGDYYCGVTRANVVGWSETAFTIPQTYTPP